MCANRPDNLPDGIVRFDGGSISGKEEFTVIGRGSVGAKAGGLAKVKRALEDKIAPSFRPSLQIQIPLLTVITTEFFDPFIEDNKLASVSLSSLTDGQIAAAFSRAALPAALVDHLRVFVSRVRTPLAVRSSSLLEDGMRAPFAGVYATRMIANHQPDVEDRLSALVAAIKYVYASTYFRKARHYVEAAGHIITQEKMAVIVQEVVGGWHTTRFYPEVSGVAQSFNFYPTGLARPEDGVVELALGLGKAIVDEGAGWPFSPAYPHANPPYNTFSDLLNQSQKHFWAIDAAKSEVSDPGNEIGSLTRYALSEAEHDAVLSLVASTYRAADDRIVMGANEPGPRILDFAYILKANLIPLPQLITELLACCSETIGTMADIEFALNMGRSNVEPSRFGFLQVRPAAAVYSQVEVSVDELAEGNVVVASEATLGNGTVESIRDIVYVKPEEFSAHDTTAVGLELESINQKLTSAGCEYLLIGFGRWGSSDPSAGIPVNFAQIRGARVIVEATLPNMDFMLSQGSHFFRNIMSFEILYLSVGHHEKHKIDWDWLNDQPAEAETALVRHVRLASPLSIRVDGRARRGLVCR